MIANLRAKFAFIELFVPGSIILSSQWRCRVGWWRRHINAQATALPLRRTPDTECVWHGFSTTHDVTVGKPPCHFNSLIIREHTHITCRRCACVHGITVANQQLDKSRTWSRVTHTAEHYLVRTRVLFYQNLLFLLKLHTHTHNN